MNWLERRERRGLGKDAAERVSADCYGSLVAASTLAGSAEVPFGELTLLVVATNLVYFGTHVFAYAIGDPRPGTQAPPTTSLPTTRGWVPR